MNHAATIFGIAQLRTGSNNTVKDQIFNARPVVVFESGKLAESANKAEQILIDAKVPIYHRAGALVRPISETVEASYGRKTKVVRLKNLDPVYLRDMLSQHADWKKLNSKKQQIPIDPPYEIPQTIIGREGDFRFQPLTGLISTPTMRPDGTLLQEAGYDQATGLLLVDPPAMPPIPEKPTREDAQSALKLLEALLVNFPFVDETAKAVALSAMITPIARGAFPVTPMHAARAPTAGSGKSFLWDVSAAMAIGQPMPVLSTGSNEAELEKRLGTALMTGQPLIALDNIVGGVGGAAVCQFIERPVVTVRILGRSEQVKIESRGTSMFATGNNFTIEGDLCRRVIVSELDAKEERPERRQFSFNPVARVMEDRGKYIAAALTICRAYAVSGVKPVPKLASFEGWSDTVRSALIWLGLNDPVLSMANSHAEDPEAAELGDMLEAWHAVFGTTTLKLAAAMESGLEKRPQEVERGTQWVPLHPDFVTAVDAIMFRANLRHGIPPDARTVGNWLKRNQHRVIDGKRFNSNPNPKGAIWRVEEV